jgi:hypothetical protein
LWLKLCRLVSCVVCQVKLPYLILWGKIFLFHDIHLVTLLHIKWNLTKDYSCCNPVQWVLSNVISLSCQVGCRIGDYCMSIGGYVTIHAGGKIWCAVSSYCDASTVQSRYIEGMQAKMFITFVIADAICYHVECVMYEHCEFSPLNWIAPTYKNRLH